MKDSLFDTGEQAQELLVPLETALHRLVESFWDEPYRFFTESDAVIALQSWVARRPELAQIQHTADGFETSLLHCEYPTFFRFREKEPTRRLGPPAKRGHYDLVLINPAYIQHHQAETVTNRDIENCGNRSSSPLLAAVEFKFFARGWSPGRVRGVERDLSKLRLALQSPPDVRAAYLCVFQRDVSKTSRRWDRHWPAIEKALDEFSGIRAVLAICWPNRARDPLVRYSGPWITTAIE
jgi:hypothetical protein